MAGVAAACVENVVESSAADGGDADEEVDALEAERLLEGAEHVRADAEAEVERDEVRRDGDADADFFNELDADGLAVRHERAVAETDEDAGEQHHPALRRDGEQEKADGQAGIRRIHDEIFTLAVEHDTGNRAGNRDGEGVNNEEQGTGGHELELCCIGSEEAQDTRVADSDAEGNDGDGRDFRLEEVGDVDLLEGSAVLLREFHLIDMHDGDGTEADDDHADAEVNDVLERENLLHEHADEGADGGSQAHREGIVVDALAAACGRDHRRDDRARSRGSDSIADTVEAADEEEHRQRMDGEVHERRGEIKQDAGVQHFLAAIELNGTAGEETGQQRAEDEDTGSEASLTHRSIQGMNGFRCDDDHQHVIDDVDEEID